MQSAQKRVLLSREEIHSRVHSSEVRQSAGSGSAEELLAVLVYILANGLDMGAFCGWAYRLLAVKKPDLLGLDVIFRISGKQNLTDLQVREVIEGFDVLWFLEIRSAFDLCGKHRGWSDPEYDRDAR